MFTTIGHFNVQPDRAQEFERLFQAFAAQVTAHEPGTLVYQLGRLQGEAHAYRLIETYRDAEAFDRHRTQPYFKAGVTALGACVAGEPRVERLEVVE